MNPPVSEVIAITGTPGVGKSTVAKILQRKGYKVFSVNKLAEELDCIIGEEEGCKIVDVDELAERIRDVLPKGTVFLEGHLSHLLNPDTIIVLRCNPIVLKERLEGKGWREDKVLENVEAEIVDSILIEALETGKEVYEIDTTNMKPEDVADAIEKIAKGDEGARKKFKPGKIDWISQVGDKIEKLMRF